MTEQITKMSQTLGRDAVFTKTVSYTAINKYIHNSLLHFHKGYSGFTFPLVSE